MLRPQLRAFPHRCLRRDLGRFNTRSKTTLRAPRVPKNNVGSGSSRGSSPSPEGQAGTKPRRGMATILMPDSWLHKKKKKKKKPDLMLLL